MERVSAQRMLFSTPLLKYLTCNFNDLELGLFKVIRLAQQRSKVMVPIVSPLSVSCLTSIVSNIVPLTVFETLDAEALWPRSRTVQGHPRSKVIIPTDSPRVISYSISIDPIIVSVTVLKYLTCNFDYLEPAQFKVILGQRSRCQSEAQWWFPI